jgi:hypothetical protein
MVSCVLYGRYTILVYQWLRSAIGQYSRVFKAIEFKDRPRSVKFQIVSGEKSERASSPCHCHVLCRPCRTAFDDDDQTRSTSAKYPKQIR